MSLPSFSVVIPAFNEAAAIGRCLSSLQEQIYQGFIEIIVVDNGSSDATADIARSYGARVIRCVQRGVVPAREAGFRACRGDIIAQTDADCRVPPCWISNMTAHFAAHPADIGVGGTVKYLDEPLWHRPLSGLGRLVSVAWQSVAHAPATIHAANFAVRRDALMAIGGYGTALPDCGDERLLLSRLEKAGHVALSSSFPVETSSRRFRGRLIRSMLFEFLISTILSLLLYKIAHRTAGFRRAQLRSEVRMTPMIPATVVSILLLMMLSAGAYAYFVPNSSMFGKVYARQRVPDKIIALTFDDGPNDHATREIMGLLDKYQVKATFFLVGSNVEAHPMLARDLVEAGHEIGNHTWDHKGISTPATYRREIMAAQQTIEHATGVRPALFRPPYGQKTPWMLAEVKKQNMRAIGWSVSANDPRQPPPEILAGRVIRGAKPGAIILLHDGAAGGPPSVDRSNTVAALPLIIERLLQQGYQFVTVSDLLQESQRAAAEKRAAGDAL